MQDDDRRISHPFPWMTWAIIGFAAVTAYVLLTEHPTHFASFLPFALLLACPLMHLFHHGHHSHGAGGPHNDAAGQEGTKSASPAGPEHRHG